MSRSLIVSLLGVALALAAAASVLINPQGWEWVFYIQSSGANELHIPFGFWIAVGAWMIAVSAASGLPLARIAPRAIIIALATHVVILLAALAPVLPDRTLFTTPIYQLYARAFCTIALAGAVWWSVHELSSGWSIISALGVPIVAATVVLAASLLRVDPIAATLGAAAGAVGWLLRQRLTDAAVKIRSTLADERIFVLTLFIVALGLRLLYLRRVMSNPGYVETGADGPVYDELAWSIAQGHGIRATFTERFPLLLLGYVWFVSAIYRIAGHSYFAVGAVQAVIGSATCLLFYDVAKELCGRAVARTAAFFAAINFPLLFAAAAIGHQAIDVFLTMAIVWLLVKSRPAPEWPWWRWCVLGALFGIAIAVRETETFFLAFVLLWIPFVFPRSQSARGLGAAALVLGAAFVTIAPLTVPKIATAQERDKLRHHFDILYRGEADPVRMRDDIVAPLENPTAALSQLRQSPGFVLATLGKAWTSNFAVQFFAQPYGGFDMVFLKKGTAYYYVVWFYAYALALAGAVTWLVRARKDSHAAAIVLVLGLIASRTVPHLILESNYRHRVPIEPFLILLASIAAVRLVTAARQMPAPAA